MSGHGPLLLIGAGRMGGALLGGWLNAGIAPSAITVNDPSASDAVQSMASEHGFSLNPSLRHSGSDRLTIILAVKPQMASALAASLQGLIRPGTMIVSIMAGKTLADLARLWPGSARIRAMPNLPAAIGQGMTVAVAAPECTSPQRAWAEQLLSSSGTVQWLDDESLMDAATGLSGSGPAYVFYLAECLAQAGMRQGFSSETAHLLARTTISGSGALLACSPASAASLRQDVTSPNGTTEAGLRVLMREGTMERIIIEAVAAATARAHDLAG